MDSSGIVVLNGLLAVAELLVMVAVFFFGRGRRLRYNAVFFGGALLGWLLAGLAANCAESPLVVGYLSDLALLFAVLWNLGVLLFVVRFYSFDAYHSATVVFMLLVIPLFTAAIVLVPALNGFVRDPDGAAGPTGAFVPAETRGVWFWMNLVYCCGLLIVSFLIVVRQYTGMSAMYRSSSRLLLLGVAVALVGVGLGVSGPGEPWDWALMGAAFCTLLLTLSAKYNKKLDYLNQARREIFDELEEAILILDDEGRVVTSNLSSRYFLYQAGMDPEERSYDRIMKNFFQSATVSRREEEDSGVDYIFQESGQRTVYNVRLREIVDKRGNKIGAVSINEDVSETHAIIRKLELEVGVDAMTGLMNRRSMEEALQAMDLPENFPLAVLVGDLNNLKAVNDRLGHQQGDALLMETAELLIQCSPPGGRLARMGGDEFLILIPHFEEEQCDEMIATLHRKQRRSRFGEYRVALAVGFSVKRAPGKPLEEHVKEAEQHMYRNKKSMKAQNLA